MSNDLQRRLIEWALMIAPTALIMIFAGLITGLAFWAVVETSYRFLNYVYQPTKE